MGLMRLIGQINKEDVEMSISNNDKDNARDFIEKNRASGVEWEDLKIVNFMPYTKYAQTEAERFTVLTEFQSFLNTATYAEWQDLVASEQAMLDSASLESENFGNKDVASNVFISKAETSSWVQYTKQLRNKNWSEGAIEGIKKSAFNILKRLSTDTTETGPIKGLVLGNVQSGKTANMAGLMAMAADNGWNYVIVLTGMIENLRLQNQKRLLSDLSGNSAAQFESIENPSLRSQRQISDLNLTGNKVYLTVGLKNSTRLKNLVRWLYSDINRARQLKLLIIDDEADQASVNVKKITDEDDEQQERTAVNKAILDLVHGVNDIKPKASNYIAYTATPYANVLNEAGENTLYPSDFIYSLTPSPDYIGPQQLFGTEEPEQQAALNIIRDIKQQDEEIIKQLNGGEAVEIPDSMKRAIDWFLIATSAMRARFVQGKTAPRPVSMLIHTSQLVNAHKSVALAVQEYLLHIKNDPLWLANAETLYRNEKNAFPQSAFIHEMSEYTVPRLKIADYPEWEDVKEQLEHYYFVLDDREFLNFAQLDEDKAMSFVKGFTMAIDNAAVRGSQSEHIRLAYPPSPNDITPVIVIGGATLSRGLTLEGLISTYFVRTTKTADTLMQMGRWFGFRTGYEVFPRIWLTADAFHRFEFISQMDADLRVEIQKYTAVLKPSEIGPKIKNSPNHRFVEITANNKKQSATETDLDFQGISKQTTVFEKNNVDILKNNVEITEKLIDGLDDNMITTKSNRGKLPALVWRDVDFDVVKPFLTDYKAPDRDLFFSNLNALVEWYEESFLSRGEATKWNIIIPSVEGNRARWQVKDYDLGKVNRSQYGQDENGVISIHTLRSGGDIGLDYGLDKTQSKTWSDVLRAREEDGLGNNPQLIIYRIDKDSTYQGNALGSRRDLNAADDLIGINISIPGNTSEESLGKSIQIKIPKDSYSIEED